MAESEPQEPQVEQKEKEEEEKAEATQQQEQEQEEKTEGGEAQPAPEEAPPQAEGGGTEEGKGEGEEKGGGGEEGEGGGEAAKEEGEQAEAAEGKGEEEDAEPEAEQQEEEEKITITHEDNPNWLSVEDCLAKGVPVEEVSAFQNIYFQHAYSIKTWYEGLADHTFPTEFITLSNEEIDVLIAASHPGQAETPELSDEQKQLLEQLEGKLNEAVEKFEGDGGFIRVNDRNPHDAILERNDAEFVAKVRDAVINELEVEKQSLNAYLIWRDQEKHEGAFRRGISRIRRSFRRPRTASASAPKKEDEQPKLQETTGEAEEGKEGATEEQKAEPAAEAEGAAEGEEKKKTEGGEQTVTVEVDVQGDSTEAAEPQTSEPAPQAEAEPQEQPAAEPAPEPEQQPKEEGEGEKKEEGEGEKGEGEIEKKDEGGEKEEGGEGEKKEEEEIQKAPEPDEGTPKKKQRLSKRKKEEQLHIIKAKGESLDNEVLRGFGRAQISLLKVTSGKEAMDMILRSGRVKQYLQQVKAFGDVEGLGVTITVSRFHADIVRYPGMVLRAFVYEDQLTALSQKHDDITYFPNVAQYRNIIQYKVKQFFSEHVKEALAERESYLIDIFVSTEKVYILRLSPFYTGVGACLFTWTEHAKVLTQGPFQFQIVEASRKAPDLYSGLQTQWSSMLDSVLQQKHNERRQHHGGRGCVLL